MSSEPNHENFSRQPEPLFDDEIVTAAIVSESNQGSDSVFDADLVDTNEMLRLHSTSLLFDLLSHGRSFLVPAVLGLFGAARGDLFWVIASAVMFVPAVMFSVLRYFTFCYVIKDDHLIVKQGLIFRNARTVPVKRIQNIDFVQNVLHRMFGVAEVKVETASGTKPEAVLRVLSMQEMESLRRSVFKSRAEASEPASLGQWDVGARERGELPEGSAVSTEDSLASDASLMLRPQNEVSLLTLSLWDLVKAGLASNRGLIMVGIAFGIYFQFAEDRNYRIFIDTVGDYFPRTSSWFWTAVVGAGIAMGALVLLRLLGIGWFILRFFGYQLIRRGDDLRISCGLFTKVSATVPRRRIQFISIHQNIFQRWMGLASIRIETASGASVNGTADASESVAKQWFVPIVGAQLIPQILAELRPGLNWDESKLKFALLHPRAVTRIQRIGIFASLLIAGLGLILSFYWGWAFGFLVLPLLLWYGRKQGRAMRYARMENGVVYKSGVLTKKTSMTFFEKIQTIELEQSPFDRRWNMATLAVDTAAAGPADHQIRVRFLDADFAESELQWLRLKTGQQQPVFG